MDRLQTDNQNLVDDLIRRVNSSKSQSIGQLVKRQSVTVAIEPGTDIRVIYHLSLFLPADMQRFHLHADIKRCRSFYRVAPNDAMDQAEEPDEPDIDESLLLSLVKHCLSWTYNRDPMYRLVDIRSTKACQVLPANRDQFESDVVTIGQLTWPKTQLGKTARAASPCVVSSQHGTYMVHRRCLGDFHQGAFWGPIQVYSSLACDHLFP